MCNWSNPATLISPRRKIWTFRAIVNNESLTKSPLSVASILSSLHGLTRSMWHPAASSDHELWAPWWLQPRPLRDHSVAGRERPIHPLSVREVKSDVTKAECPLWANHSAGQTDRRETQSPACFWLIVTDGVGTECVRCSGLSSTNVLVSTDRCTFMCTAECPKNVSLLLTFSVWHWHTNTNTVFDVHLELRKIFKGSDKGHSSVKNGSSSELSSIYPSMPFAFCVCVCVCSRCSNYSILSLPSRK